jgi:hypothetical protein
MGGPDRGFGREDALLSATAREVAIVAGRGAKARNTGRGMTLFTTTLPGSGERSSEGVQLPQQAGNARAAA